MKKYGRIAALTAITLIIAGCPTQALKAQNTDNWYDDLELKPYQLDTSSVEESGYILSDRAYDVPEANEGGSGLLRASSLPSAYMNDLATLMSTYPATRLQEYSTCWAYSAVGLAEFDLIADDKLYDRSVDFSEIQLAYFSYNHVEDPLEGTYGDVTKISSGYNYLTIGGNMDFTTRALMQWEGVIPESEISYTDAATVKSIDGSYAYGKNVAHLQNMYLLDIHKNTDEVKRQIMEHGAVGTGYHASENFVEDAKYIGYGMYNGTMVDTYYCDNAKLFSNHAVNIVGWDDNFPASNFTSVPAGDGAWLVRNSWSDVTGFKLNSYFWLSYYDATLEDAAWIYDFESADNYDNNYQYDGCAVAYDCFGLNTTANVFTVKADANEQLEAVSISLLDHADVPYTIKVYTNLVNETKPRSGYLAATVKGKTSSAGVYTIPLETAVPLAKGTKFSVVVELGQKNVGVDMECSYTDSYGAYRTTAYIEPGQSYAVYDGAWMDMEELNVRYHTGNFCIKAYTSELEGDTVSQVKNLKKKTASKTSITLSWSKVSGADGYIVYRSTSKNGTYKKVKTITSGSKTSYKDTGLAKNTTYYYRVRAYKKNEVSVDTTQTNDLGVEEIVTTTKKTTTVGKMSSVTAIKTTK